VTLIENTTVNPQFIVGAAMLLIGLTISAVLLITNWGRS
jgi:hypothetical protein